MKTVRLGQSGLTVNQIGFGAIPLQRLTHDEAVALLRRAVDAGIDFFDTARGYTDSEHKLGAAFAESGVRQRLVIASKTHGEDGAAIKADLTASLAELRTDYLDLYQTHNPKTVPMPDDGTERYETLAALKQAGIVRAIGLTSHSLENALTAAHSGLYDTVMYPFCFLSSPEEEALAEACVMADVGFIAMKGLAGGVITNIPAAFAYMRRFSNVAPIWGMQSISELEEFLRLDADPPVWNAAMQTEAEQERMALGDRFCRKCGYCRPCPQGISVISLMAVPFSLHRKPWQEFATPGQFAAMQKAKSCTTCGACIERCPYGLKPPELFEEHMAYYEQFMKEKGVWYKLKIAAKLECPGLMVPGKS